MLEHWLMITYGLCMVGILLLAHFFLTVYLGMWFVLTWPHEVKAQFYGMLNNFLCFPVYLWLARKWITVILRHQKFGTSCNCAAWWNGCLISIIAWYMISYLIFAKYLFGYFAYLQEGMTRKTKQPERMTWQPSSIGDLALPSTFLYYLAPPPVFNHSLTLINKYNSSTLMQSGVMIPSLVYCIDSFIPSLTTILDGLACRLVGLPFPDEFDSSVVKQLSTYEAELEVMKNMTRQEYVASLRR